jgi:gamma-glutamylcyclotransferase (GGCT)/AIG2-like uncharacterized protein YtfP
MIDGMRFVRESRTEAAFTLLDLGPFPALREGGTTAVVGEVYEVTAEQLAVLDRFEGVPRLYERIMIRLEDGEMANAYVQRGATRPHDFIPSGDWRQYRKDRNDARPTA